MRWKTKISLPSILDCQYKNNYDATMRQTLVLILAAKVAEGRSVLQPATILTCGPVNLCNEINKCTCIKYVSSLD
jgi:hypothetical protein